ncbi:hypothetical protein BGC39_02100 [Levilactobacillus brevis]|nr:hypothetical protein BGC39_02100 [Levilactobacillus brevis]
MHMNAKKYVFTRLGFSAQMVHIEFMCGLITLVSRLLRMTSNPARGINNASVAVYNRLKRLEIGVFILLKKL